MNLVSNHVLREFTGEPTSMACNNIYSHLILLFSFPDSYIPLKYNCFLPEIRETNPQVFQSEKNCHEQKINIIDSFKRDLQSWL